MLEATLGFNLRQTRNYPTDRLGGVLSNPVEPMSEVFTRRRRFRFVRTLASTICRRPLPAPSGDGWLELGCVRFLIDRSSQRRLDSAQRLILPRIRLADEE